MTGPPTKVNFSVYDGEGAWDFAHIQDAGPEPWPDPTALFVEGQPTCPELEVP